MAKILVADDNSNIQKMVGLALKDQGIDVVAVGNGEAAVRKISDVRPDLVLADVFMPVRNGYEVCKYVKDDSTLAHIPVILLVGAFDPLDEQEAQRVGADGVLKKPFVPPDPLISMVKSALSRSGVLPSDKPAEQPPLQAMNMLAPRAPEVPTLGTVPAFGDYKQEASEPVTARPEPVRMDSGAPLAFGSLLETPVVKETEEEEDLSYLPAAQAQLAPERTWGAPEEPQETQEEEEERPSWRRGGEEIDDAGIPAGGRAGDWRDTVMAEITSRRSARESWEPAVEHSSAVETKKEPAAVATTESLPAPTPISAAKPSTSPFAGDAWPSAASAISPAGNGESAASVAVEAPPAVESAPVAAVVEAVEPAKETVAVAEEQQPEAPAKPSTAENWFAPAPSPWDAELKKASELASGWDSPKPEAEPVAKAEEATVVEAAQEAGLPNSAVEAIREEAALVAETAPADNSNQTASAAEPKMDDLVAKVLAKMSPDVLQAVTREILKPVVEAMVRDELNARKP